MAEFTSIGETIQEVLKEVRRRSELRPRLEAELDRRLSDDEFLEIANRTGLKI